MKEIKINYFVPENLEGLSKLEGKVVGVCITYLNSPESMVYYGFKDDRHEFLTQGKMRVQDTEDYDLLNEVRGWRLENGWILFKKNGITLNHEGRTKTYYPSINEKEFEKRRNLLKENNLWGEPR